MKQAFVALTLLATPLAFPAAGEAVRARVALDSEAGKPLIAHVIVALCDNRYQGIVPVPRHLGNGQDPRSNLYWGAAYGIRTYLPVHCGWQTVSQAKSTSEGVLNRVVLRSGETVGGKSRQIYLVAEAWDGKKIKEAIVRFFALAAGREPEPIRLSFGGKIVDLTAGGAAHLVAFVGHNGLMDFHSGEIPSRRPDAQPNSAVILACASKPYFLDKLRLAGSHPLLLTTGLMAPEAYTLDAVVRTWFRGETPNEVREAAAAAYTRFQGCGMIAARRLFSVEQ